MTNVIRFGRHWYWMLVATFRLLLGFAFAARYFKERTYHDLQLPEPTFLSSKEKRRLKHYFYGGTFLQLLFETLQPKCRSNDQGYRLSNLAALAYYFDDLLEVSQEQELQGFNWKDQPKAFGQRMDDHRQLALHFLENLHRQMSLDRQAAFDQVMHRVFNTEMAAKQHPPSDLDTLIHHAAEKGGYSVLLFRQLSPIAPSALEESALFAFGHLIQACDDIFDAWFDIQERVPTFATYLLQRGQLSTLSDLFERQVEVTHAAFSSSGMPAAQVETALRIVHYITAITRVCLQHYQKMVDKHGKLLLDNRAAMVVDMERWNHRFATAFELALRFP